MIIGVVIGAAVALPIMGNNAQTQQTEQQGGQQLPGQKDGENETTPNEGGGAVQNRVTGAMPEANVPVSYTHLDVSKRQVQRENRAIKKRLEELELENSALKTREKRVTSLDATRKAK